MVLLLVSFFSKYQIFNLCINTICFLKSHFQLESDGFNLKAIESYWSSTSAAAGNSSNTQFQPSQTNPMDYQPEPFLQIG